MTLELEVRASAQLRELTHHINCSVTYLGFRSHPSVAPLLSGLEN